MKEKGQSYAEFVGIIAIILLLGIAVIAMFNAPSTDGFQCYDAVIVEKIDNNNIVAHVAALDYYVDGKFTGLYFYDSKEGDVIRFYRDVDSKGVVKSYYIFWKKESLTKETCEEVIERLYH